MTVNPSQPINQHTVFTNPRGPPFPVTFLHERRITALLDKKAAKPGFRNLDEFKTLGPIPGIRVGQDSEKSHGPRVGVRPFDREPDRLGGHRP
jgi:hypothetical protein